MSIMTQSNGRLGPLKKRLIAAGAELAQVDGAVTTQQLHALYVKCLSGIAELEAQGMAPHVVFTVVEAHAVEELCSLAIALSDAAADDGIARKNVAAYAKLVTLIRQPYQE